MALFTVGTENGSDAHVYSADDVADAFVQHVAATFDWFVPSLIQRDILAAMISDVNGDGSYYEVRGPSGVLFAQPERVQV